MTPIPIKLDDCWTQQRRTVLYWGKGQLSGLGISFDVWRHMLSFDDGSWFATVLGGCADNLVAASIVPAKRPAAPQRLVVDEETLSAGNISRDINLCRFGELTPDLLYGLGFSECEDVALNECVTGCLHLHDDFLFSLALNRPDFLQSALSLVVRVHLHYLGRPLSPGMQKRLILEVQTLLESEGHIELQSNPVTEQVVIGYQRPAENWFKRLLGFKRQFKVSIDINSSPFGTPNDGF